MRTHQQQAKRREKNSGLPVEICPTRHSHITTHINYSSTLLGNKSSEMDKPNLSAYVSLDYSSAAWVDKSMGSRQYQTAGTLYLIISIQVERT